MNLLRVSPIAFEIRNEDGTTACALHGGIAVLIADTYGSLLAVDEKRASDYLMGVLNGISHCWMVSILPRVNVKK